MKKITLDSQSSPYRITTFVVIYILLHIFTSSVYPQNGNFSMPIAEIEQILENDSLDVHKIWNIRKQGLVRRLLIISEDNRTVLVKWKRAPGNGHTVNNAPRFEIASYKLQKMFLDENEYVVPPTTGRSIPIADYGRFEINYEKTFSNSTCIFGGVQYWLNNVSADNVYDPERFETDKKYARHLANMNIFTYLVKHNDSNVGNFLISTIESDPRIFVPDNGFTFGSRVSERGSVWRDIRVNKLPEKTIERLRNITRDDLHKELGVVLQIHEVNGLLEPMTITDNLDATKGVRESEGIIQFGLTAKEIDGVADRLQSLLNDIDAGRYELF